MYRFLYLFSALAFIVSVQASTEPSSCFGVIFGLGWGGSYMSSKGATLNDGFASSDSVSFSRSGNVSRSQPVVNFTGSATTKNHCGFSYLAGVWGQYITSTNVCSGTKISLGFSVNVGQIGSRSDIYYPVGQISYANNTSGATFNSSDDSVFSGKDTAYLSQLVHFGGVVGPVNPFISVGLAEHMMKLSYVNAFGKSSQGIHRTYTMPVLGLGCNVQLSSRISIGIQVQRHFGNTKTVQGIESILPDTKAALGNPTIKTSSYVALVHVIYGWSNK